VSAWGYAGNRSKLHMGPALMNNKIETVELFGSAVTIFANHRIKYDSKKKGNNFDESWIS
jgi:hypothetical protein